jgi:broad specificity phosphatase PhoE
VPEFNRLLLLETRTSYGLQGACVNQKSEKSLATTLLLVCAGSTRSSRVGGFPAPDEPLDDPGRQAASSFSIARRFGRSIVTSPTRAARDTAEAMGMTGVCDNALADIDHGLWTGQTFDEVYSQEPAEFADWLADPTKGAPGGEAMEIVRRRVADWLGRTATLDRPLCAIAHPTVIRTALSHALTLPLASTLAIDIAPLSRTVLSFNGRWRVQALIPND